MPKKVVHLTSVHQPFDTRIFLKQCRTLAREGFEVVLIAPHTREEVVEGVQIRPVEQPRGRFARMLFTTFRIAFSALHENGDLYHIHDPELLPVGRWLQWRGYHVVFDMHENLPKSLLTKRWIWRPLRRPASFLCRVFERYLLGSLPVVFAETSYQADYQWVKQSRIALNMPVIEDIPLTRQQHVTPTVGYIGVVCPSRGSRLTVEALGRLKQSGCEVNFECVGPISVEHQRELTECAGKLGSPGIRFYGEMPPQNGWSIIAQCHIGLAILQAVPNFIHSYPTKMFEYMAMGLPVIVTDVPLYRQVIESADCGICVDPENPAAVTEAIRWLVAHPDESARMGQRGRQAVLQHYSWEAEADKLLNLYEELFDEDDHNRGSESTAGETGRQKRSANRAA